MAMSPERTEGARVAILAKAPVAGYAKTRLEPALGAEGAAMLQRIMIEATIATALAAELGPVTIWATPGTEHEVFTRLAHSPRVTLARQPDGDLGIRMLAAFAASKEPTLVIGTDCPALTPMHLADAAAALTRGCDAALVPARDGGYVLIGLARPQPALFYEMPWGTAEVAAETRRRMTGLALNWKEWPALPDIDRPDDLEGLRGDARFAALFSRRRGG